MEMNNILQEISTTIGGATKEDLKSKLLLISYLVEAGDFRQNKNEGTRWHVESSNMEIANDGICSTDVTMFQTQSSCPTVALEDQMKLLNQRKRSMQRSKKASA